MGSIGIFEILLIVAIVALFFGSSQIPKIAKSLGEGIRELKKGLKESDEKEKNKINNKSKK